MQVDIQIDLDQVARDNDCVLLEDASDVRSMITVNAENVKLEDIEYDKTGINIITDGEIIPHYVITMIKVDRWKEVKGYLEAEGL